MGVNLVTILDYGLSKNQNLAELAETILTKLKALPLPRCINYDNTLDTSEWECLFIEKHEVTDKWGTYTVGNEIAICGPGTMNLYVFDAVAYLIHVERWSFFTEPEHTESCNQVRYGVFLIANALGIKEAIYAGDNATEWIDESVSYEDAKTHYSQIGLWTDGFAGFQQAVSQKERSQGLYFSEDFSDFTEEGKNTPDPAKICKMYDEYFQNSYYTYYPERDTVIFSEQAQKGGWYILFYLLHKELTKPGGNALLCLQWAKKGIAIILNEFHHRIKEAWATRFLYLTGFTYLWCNHYTKAYELETNWFFQTDDEERIFLMKRYLGLLLVKHQYLHFEALMQQDWSQTIFNDFYWFYHYAVLHPNKIMAKEHHCLFEASSIVKDMENLFGKTV